MTDAVVFGFGCLVTLICAAAIASLNAGSLPRWSIPERTREKIWAHTITGYENRRGELDSVAEDIQKVA